MTVNRPALRQPAVLLSRCVALLLLAAVPALAQPPEPEAKHPLFFLWIAAFLFLVLVAALACSVAFVAVLSGTKSDLLDREAEILESHRTAAFWWGLPTTGVLLFLSAAFTNQADDGRLMASLVFGLWLAAAIIGGAGLSTKVGRQIMHSWGKPDASPGAAATAGALALFLMTLTPLVGWAYGLYNLVLSVGAFRLAAISRRPRVTPRVVGSQTASIERPTTPSSPTH
jgi:hypothetical protein